MTVGGGHGPSTHRYHHHRPSTHRGGLGGWVGVWVADPWPRPILTPPPPPGSLSNSLLKSPWALKVSDALWAPKAPDRKFCPLCPPNTILKPNPNPNAHPNPQPSPNSTPTPSPNPSPSSNPRLGSQYVLGSKMESNDVAKAAMNKIWGILFSLINMAGTAEPTHCKGQG